MGTQNTPQPGANTSTDSTQGINGLGGTDAGMNAGGTESAEGVAGIARNLASQAQQKVGEQVRSSVDSGRTRAADTLQQVARTLMQGDETGDNPAAPYMNKAGEQVQRFADYLQNADMRQMMTGAEQFARRQPAVFLGGAFALGVIAARFFKSTPERNSYGDSGYGTDRLYDRERSLSNYREPGAGATGGYGADSGYGTTGSYGASGLSGSAGGTAQGADLDWPGSTGGSLDTPSTDYGSGNR
ncbi:MAG TPA: hypothetical protein VE869_03480 [Gemmatimonas sp.]|nr:hypothetical protein [Gemmatimonas sp.]